MSGGKVNNYLLFCYFVFESSILMRNFRSPVLPNRVYDVRDIVLNGLAGMAGLYLFEIHCERGCKKE